MGAPGMNKAFTHILKWTDREEWHDRRHQIIEYHLGPACDHFDIDLEDLVQEIGTDRFAAAVSCAFDDLLTREFEPDNRNVVDDYLERRGWKESVPAKRYLQAVRNSVMSLYEVIDTVPASHLVMKDLVKGGEPIRVEDRLGSASAVRWDRLAARVVHVNGKNYLSPGLLRLSMESAEMYLGVLDRSSKRAQREFRKLAKTLSPDGALSAMEVEDVLVAETAPMLTRIWLHETLESARMPWPEFRNLDGDELVFSEVRIPVPDANVAQIERRLDGEAELERRYEDDRRWHWVGGNGAAKKKANSRRKGLTFGSFDDRGRAELGMVELEGLELVLSVNSRERAERGGRLLAALLEGLVSAARTSYQTLDDLLDGHDQPEKSAADEIPPEAAAKILQEFLDRHYRTCMSDKIPMLDDKSPRQAARTKSGRAKLVQWLKYLENGEMRRARDQDQEPYDLGWLWSELGVTELREHPR